MALLKLSSPHAHSPGDTGTVMRLVILATLPGVLALTYFFGFGSLINILLACIVAVACEALVMALRKRPVWFYLRDCSALLTAVLLGIALPPYAPWWLVVSGSAIAILLAKQLYGGLGYNPFNPAMVAYVVLLISFPVQMTAWAAPLGAGDIASVLGPIDALRANLFGSVDAVTMATPLDIQKQNTTLMVDDLFADTAQFGSWGGLGWEWVNAGFLLGGLFLLWRGIFTWHAPVAMLVTLALCSALFYDAGSSASTGSVMFHLFSGGTMLGAFFILTDPVSSATSNRGRLVFGAGAGLLLFIIRAWGNYPDAIAFAVLLMNFAAPLIDNYTQPRTYGYKKKEEAP